MMFEDREWGIYREKFLRGGTGKKRHAYMKGYNKGPEHLPTENSRIEQVCHGNSRQLKMGNSWRTDLKFKAFWKLWLRGSLWRHNWLKSQLCSFLLEFGFQFKWDGDQFWMRCFIERIIWSDFRFNKITLGTFLGIKWSRRARTALEPPVKRLFTVTQVGEDSGLH